jgi:hypothetical protein
VASVMADLRSARPVRALPAPLRSRGVRGAPHVAEGVGVPGGASLTGRPDRTIGALARAEVRPGHSAGTDGVRLAEGHC